MRQRPRPAQTPSSPAPSWGASLPARLKHRWGRFVGPEATDLNDVLTAVSALAGGLAAAMVTRRRGGGPAATATVALLAADLIGGAYVNNTLASTRWYERPGQGSREHLRFAACHVHPALIAWLDRGQPGKVPPPVWAALHYGYLMAATATIRSLPGQRRVLGPVLTAGGIALDAAVGSSRLVPWFAPSYYSKLLLGHASATLYRDEQLSAS